MGSPPDALSRHICDCMFKLTANKGIQIMTYATFQTNSANSKLATAWAANFGQIAIAMRSAFSNISLNRRHIDGAAILEAQAHSESARQAVNNLLR